MKYIYHLLLLLVFASAAHSQAFVTLDNDTFEIVENVNYSLYKDKQVVYSGVAAPDTLTFVNGRVFDSISFSRVDYKEYGFARQHWDSAVFLSKKTIYLDEVVVGNKKDKEIVLGETNRFVKRRSRPLAQGYNYGLVFYNGLPYKLQLDKVVFYTDKVKLKTAYRVNFSEIEEMQARGSNQFAEPGKIFYSTDILYLNPKDKGQVELALLDFDFPSTRKMFVWVELIEYYDETGVVVKPELDKQTRIKFQLSDKMNYYSKMSDLYTKQLSEEIINQNLMISYDFANLFFTTPHKSDLVAPALVLYAHKPEPKPIGGININNKL